MSNLAHSFEDLKNELNQEWSAISKAKNSTRVVSGKLRALLSKEPPADTSVVAFGSLARGEWTSGSDVDWTLLIDGSSAMAHFDVTKRVEEILNDNEYKKPGPTGTFGSMSSSHELVHHIGGMEDSNQNLTRRMLLLLESIALSGDIVRDRVLNAILERYVMGDPPATKQTGAHVPLFLLNDVARFWRTMAVDYATKKWQRSNEGWALRNVKLRMSRKLLSVKGLLMCFLCHRDFTDTASTPSPPGISPIVVRCKEFVDTPAIDLLCYALKKFAKKETSLKILNAYDEFLAMLDNEEERGELQELSFEEKENALLNRMRDVSRYFRDGINELFFDSNKKLADLTRKYGVF